MTASAVSIAETLMLGAAQGPNVTLFVGPVTELSLAPTKSHSGAYNLPVGFRKENSRPASPWESMPSVLQQCPNAFASQLHAKACKGLAVRISGGRTGAKLQFIDPQSFVTHFTGYAVHISRDRNAVEVRCGHCCCDPTKVLRCIRRMFSALVSRRR